MKSYLKDENKEFVIFMKMNHFGGRCLASMKKVIDIFNQNVVVNVYQSVVGVEVKSIGTINEFITQVKSNKKVTPPYKEITLVTIHDV